MTCLITGVGDDYELRIATTTTTLFDRSRDNSLKLRIDDGAFERIPGVDDLEITNTAGTSLIAGSNII